MAGEAALRAGELAAALAHLDAAERMGSSARGRRWLALALERDAAAQLAMGELVAAEATLARADGVASSASITRTLGVLRLELGNPAGAVEALARSVALAPAAETYLALGRAHLDQARVADARAALKQAAARAKGRALAVTVAIEQAALELAEDKAVAAVEVLEGVARTARALGGDGDAPALAASYRDARIQAHHAAGVAALRTGGAARAVALLERADGLAGGKLDDIRCDLALATVATGEREAARKRLTAVAKLRCPFPAPADTQAVPILRAFADGLDARRAAVALKALGKLEGKVTGAARRLIDAAIRVVALRGAELAYRDGKLAAARVLLKRAQGRAAKVGGDELALDLVVLDIAEGTLDGAAAALERLAPKLPEALISLGVLADRAGDGATALAHWRAARKAGVHFAPLDAWIASKQRIWRSGGQP